MTIISPGIVQAAYDRLAHFMLQPTSWREYKPTLGPITEAQHIRRENYEKGRLLYEKAKKLGFYAGDDDY